MSIEELTPAERLIYHKGYMDGKKDGNRLVWYLGFAFLLIFAGFVSMVIKKH